MIPRTATLILAFLALLAGCSRGPVKQEAQAVTAAPAVAPETVAPVAPVSRWIFPITGGLIPTAAELLPNATREYRNGVHQGVDLYHKAGDQTVSCGEPVLNAREGWVVRADVKWNGLNERTYEMLLAESKQGPDEKALDRLRGRQIWIRDADGWVIRYCHLSGIGPDLQVGLKVPAGIRIGSVGNTGTLDGAKGTGLNCHLHFEVWTSPDTFLGKGQSPEKARELLRKLFEPPKP